MRKDCNESRRLSLKECANVLFDCVNNNKLRIAFYLAAAGCGVEFFSQIAANDDLKPLAISLGIINGTGIGAIADTLFTLALKPVLTKRRATATDHITCIAARLGLNK
jgi:hypothetical protein